MADDALLVLLPRGTSATSRVLAASVLAAFIRAVQLALIRKEAPLTPQAGSSYIPLWQLVRPIIVHSALRFAVYSPLG
jgi:hypothetical protein